MTTRTNDRTRSIALTLRPKNGLARAHEHLLRKYLHKHAAQWEFYEETLNDDPSTRHVHGRILYDSSKRMDKLKVQIIRFLDMDLDEKRVLQKGIKWLYDDWEYAAKDGLIWDRNITDEEDWEYADPANKTIKTKNAEIQHWLSFIRNDLPAQVTADVVKLKLMKYVVQNLIEMPMPATFNQKCVRLAEYWNYLQSMPAEDAAPDSEDDESPPPLKRQRTELYTKD